MENKKEKNLDQKSFYTNSLSLCIIAYFFYGFISNENSAGAGPYDFELIWSNLVLIKESILINLDNQLYNDSRPPLSYIVHALFNPLSNSKESFRLSVLFISCLVPILFFFIMKKKYPLLRKDLIIFLTCIITLSPYFRTSAYWGLGENYGLIFLLSSYLIFLKLEDLNNNNLLNKRIFLIFIICFFSSLCVYFDQKLIFVPLFFLFLILELDIELRSKVLTIIFYFIFSIPFLYLIYLWGNILPPSASSSRYVGQKIHLYHIGYCLTIIAFYITPFLIFLKIKTTHLKKEFLTKKFLYLSAIFFMYILILILFSDFSNLPKLGKGFVHKFLILIFDNVNLRFLFTLISFFLAFIVIFIFFKGKLSKFFVIFFLILSIFTYPFQQEYLDPLIYLLVFTLFDKKLVITYNKSYLLALFFLIFSITSKIYYNITLA